MIGNSDDDNDDDDDVVLVGGEMSRDVRRGRTERERKVHDEFVGFEAKGHGEVEEEEDEIDDVGEVVLRRESLHLAPSNGSGSGSRSEGKTVKRGEAIDDEGEGNEEEEGVRRRRRREKKKEDKVDDDDEWDEEDEDAPRRKRTKKRNREKTVVVDDEEDAEGSRREDDRVSGIRDDLGEIEDQGRVESERGATRKKKDRKHKKKDAIDELFSGIV